MFIETRRECIPAADGLAKRAVSCTKRSHVALGVPEIGVAILG